MDPLNLERMMAHRLSQLPAPAAPPTLAPRVMAAVRASTRPVAATGFRPWFVWPRVWQATFVLTLVAVMAASALAWTTLAQSPGAHGWTLALGAASNAVETVGAIAAIVQAAVSVCWSLLLHPFVLGLLLWFGLMAAACVFFATLLGRVAFMKIDGWKGAHS
jgi:hypothetical protein